MKANPTLPGPKPVEPSPSIGHLWILGCIQTQICYQFFHFFKCAESKTLTNRCAVRSPSLRASLVQMFTPGSALAPSSASSTSWQSALTMRQSSSTATQTVRNSYEQPDGLFETAAILTLEISLYWQVSSRC